MEQKLRCGVMIRAYISADITADIRLPDLPFVYEIYRLFVHVGSDLRHDFSLQKHNALNAGIFLTPSNRSSRPYHTVSERTH